MEHIDSKKPDQVARLKDAVAGKLPLTVAYAEIARIDPRAGATLYNTYTTTSGVNDNVGDDGVVGDKD